MTVAALPTRKDEAFRYADFGGAGWRLAGGA